MKRAVPVLLTATLDTPIGTIRWTETNEGICALGFCDGWKLNDASLRRRFGEVRLDERSSPNRDLLAAYFDGELGALDHLPVDTGGTEFQRLVWTALRKIPVGTTVSYSDLATSIGRQKAVRAVGTANGANPVAIIVPCHRAIGANGTLTGYAFGLERKRWLLGHEGLGFELISAR